MKRILLLTVAFALSSAAFSAAEESAPVSAPEAAAPVLRHAVVCPPFKGDPELAPLYHAALLDALSACPRIELLPPSRRARPAYTYRIDGRIISPHSPDGDPQVLVTLTDLARNETISSILAPAGRNADLRNWKKGCTERVERAANALPFECRVSKLKKGQNSYTIDRGSSAGLQPGMVLFAADEEDELYSPETGEAIGRNSPRAFGKILIFRTNEQSAYGRPYRQKAFPKGHAPTFVAREF